MIFEYRRKIFGYECDIYGHLNNAVYQHLYEEARSDALERMELPLKVLNDEGIQIFLRKIEIDYLMGIPMGSEVLIKSRISEYNRVKSLWLQEIENREGDIMSRALVTGVFIKNGKPYRIEEQVAKILRLFADK